MYMYIPHTPATYAMCARFPLASSAESVRAAPANRAPCRESVPKQGQTAPKKRRAAYAPFA